MATILHIDTTGSTAMVFLANDAELLMQLQNEQQNDHAAFLQPAIARILQKNNLQAHQIDAVAVSNGPGSYTGLRVGLASAKGLCYALNKPLISISSLQILAVASHIQCGIDTAVYAPMIDARRMEVFTALYNNRGIELIPAHAAVLNNDSFVEELLQHTIVFSGSGAEKFSTICTHPQAVFLFKVDIAQSFATLAFSSFTQNNFAPLAYCEPLYVKEFFSGK